MCNIPDVSDKLESQMFGAVKSFAHTGNPNHDGIPHWPPVQPGVEHTMVFDRMCEVRKNYDDALMDLLQV